MQPNRRQFIVASGVALAGTGALSGAAAAETSGAPAPDDPGQYDYPTTTEDAEAPVATVYGGFDCPYTADMVEESFRDILEEFVEPGRLTLTFRALEYDENGDPYISQDGVVCGQAAGGVWQEDPDSFWDFFAEVWQHQPGDMSESKIEEIMNDAGVENAAYIADNLENWDPELRETADDAYAEGVEWTPTIELKGDLGNREDVVEWIEARLDDDGEQQEAEESEETQESDGSEEDTDEDDSGSGEESGDEAGEEGTEGSDGSDAEDSEESDAGSDGEASDDGDGTSEDERSGSGDEQSGSSDGGSGSDESSTDESADGGSDDSDDSDDSDGSSGSGGTGGGGGNAACGDGDRASDPSHGENSQSSQSFVFPEASGTRRFL